MQLMPATARDRSACIDSFSAAANLDGGARYLARMLEPASAATRPWPWRPTTPGPDR